MVDVINLPAEKLVLLMGSSDLHERVHATP